MALVENAFKGWGGGLLIGVGAALAAPVLLPAAAAIVRPLMKAAVLGYLAVADNLQEVVAEAREQVGDLVAEAQAERTGTHTKHRPTAHA